MRSIILSIFVALSVSAHADAPNDALKTTIKDLMTILQINNQAQRVQQLCKLVNADVDVATIAPQLLGSFSGFTPDAAGIKAFNSLVPSIIVSDFYSLLSDKAGATYTVDSVSIAKGSSKVAYKVDIGGTSLTVTVSKKNNKVLDVEWNSFSLIKTKADEYQGTLQAKSASSPKPVSDLVTDLTSSGKLIRCN
ncbi:MAG: ABC transporter substrate-binding protein [Bdellovibrionales bacterium]